jgi:nitroreductase
VSVADTIARRKSSRAFLPDPVDQTLLEDIIRTALQSASNSNIQPWHVYLVTGDRLDRLKGATAERSTVPPEFDDPDLSRAAGGTL